MYAFCFSVYPHTQKSFKRALNDERSIHLLYFVRVLVIVQRVRDEREMGPSVVRDFVRPIGFERHVVSPLVQSSFHILKKGRRYCN